MGLSTRDPDAKRRARALIDAAGGTMTGAVLEALCERLRIRREPSRSERSARLGVSGKRFAALPALHAHTPDGIIGHDERSEVRG